MATPLCDYRFLYSYLKWFDFLSMRNCKIFGYVIMPNHPHMLLYLPVESATIHKVIGEGKRFMAYKIVSKLKEHKNEVLLKEMSEGVNTSELKNKVKHKVFEDSFDYKECFSAEFIQQKLNYMHQNPIHPKWQLSAAPEKYLHSSAMFYNTGIQGIYPVTHYLDYYALPMAK